MSKQKPNPSLPSAGVRDSKSKKATSFPAGSGVPGAPDSATTRGKDPAANEETRRSDSQPENWKRKDRKSHADEAAKREQC